MESGVAVFEDLRAPKHFPSTYFTVNFGRRVYVPVELVDIDAPNPAKAAKLKEKMKKKKKHPRGLSAYNLFVKAGYAKNAASADPQDHKTLFLSLSKGWSQLSKEDRVPFEEKAATDKAAMEAARALLPESEDEEDSDDDEDDGKKKKNKKPHAPSSYNLFIKHRYAEEGSPPREGFFKLLTVEWSELSKEGKQKFVDQAMAGKEEMDRKYAAAVASGEEIPMTEAEIKKMKKEKKKEKKKNKKKRGPSAYNLFIKESFAEKGKSALHSEGDGDAQKNALEFVKELGAKWSSMSSDDRQQYADKAAAIKLELEAEQAELDIANAAANESKKQTKKQKKKATAAAAAAAVAETSPAKGKRTRAPSAFTYFIKELKGSKVPMKEAAASWKEMSDEDKQPFVDECNEAIEHAKQQALVAASSAAVALKKKAKAAGSGGTADGEKAPTMYLVFKEQMMSTDPDMTLPLVKSKWKTMNQVERNVYKPDSADSNLASAIAAASADLAGKNKKRNAAKAALDERIMSASKKAKGSKAASAKKAKATATPMKGKQTTGPAGKKKTGSAAKTPAAGSSKKSAKSPTAYLVFLKEHHAKMRADGVSFKDIAKRIPETWKKQSKKEIARYTAIAEKGDGGGEGEASGAASASAKKNKKAPVVEEEEEESASTPTRKSSGRVTKKKKVANM